MQVYPIHRLPPPTTDFQGAVRPNVIRTEFDDGATRQVRRFMGTQLRFSASWSFTDEEFAIFQGFLEHKLTSGADWFEMDLPWHSGFRTYEVRIVEGVYTGNYVGHQHWNVSAQLETRGASFLAEAVLDQLLSETTTILPEPLADGLFTREEVLNMLNEALVNDLVNEHRVNVLNADYIIQTEDIHTFFRVDSSDDVVITLPDGNSSGFSDEFVAAVTKVGSGQVSFVGGSPSTVIESRGVTVANTLTAVAIHYIGNNRWHLYGDLI